MNLTVGISVCKVCKPFRITGLKLPNHVSQATLTQSALIEIVWEDFQGTDIPMIIWQKSNHLSSQ